MMVRPRADTFFATRDIVLAGGVLHKFIKLKFPSLKRDFEADPGLLERYVKYVQIDHLVSSGADFDENLWYGASASDELFRAFAPGIPKNSSLHRLDFKGLNQFFGEVTAMQLKRDRVRAHVWGRVTARFNAIAENCAGVWKL